MSDRPLPPARKIGFILASTDHGTMIVNRFDYKMDDKNAGFGVGYKILNESSFEFSEISIGAFILESRRKLFGDGVVAVDCGANIGTHTIDWARQMTGWGTVTAIEAQQRIFYALAGNVAINNCFNATVIHAVVGASNGTARIPEVNYLAAASFGSLELKPARAPEDIGQAVDYAAAKLRPVRSITVDTLGLQRLDLLKIDVEGMECDVLEGARRMIQQHLPVIIAEHTKTGSERIVRFLEHYGYRTTQVGMNVLAIHPSDETIKGFGPQANAA